MADRDSAVDGLHVDGRTAAAKVGVEPVLDLSLDGDGEVDVDAAVDGAGFKMRGVMVGDAQIDTAVGGVGVEAFSLPVIAGERNIQVRH